ncbi:MAG: hypothetical protein HOQ07_10430, partial [Sinomonas sp.]|nr:hypothetical protein [Sinomonas sp.]
MSHGGHIGRLSASSRSRVQPFAVMDILARVDALRAQGRDVVKVYGVNGNAQALENIKNGF